MADTTLHWVPWLPGTQVGVFPRRSELMLEDQPPPLVPLVTTAIVADDQSLALGDLAEDSYWAIAPIGSRFRYVSFLVQDRETVPV